MLVAFYIPTSIQNSDLLEGTGATGIVFVVALSLSRGITKKATKTRRPGSVGLTRVDISLTRVRHTYPNNCFLIG